MWRSKKFVIVAVLAAVLLAGSIGGVALAQTGDEDESTPQTLLDRVCAILQVKGYDITCEDLEDAFAQAGGEMQTEAMRNRLQSLVAEGTMTQQQADDCLQWWGATESSYRPRSGQQPCHHPCR